MTQTYKGKCHMFALICSSQLQITRAESIPWSNCRNQKQCEKEPWGQRVGVPGRGKTESRLNEEECISYFSIVVIKHHDKGGLVWVCGSRGIRFHHHYEGEARR